VRLIQGSRIVGEQDKPEESESTHSRLLEVRLDGFAWDALSRESCRLGVSAEELARFSVLYYLADVDSGRISRDVHGMPTLQDD
jgi:hypothetical protein